MKSKHNTFIWTAIKLYLFFANHIHNAVHMLLVNVQKMKDILETI